MIKKDKAFVLRASQALKSISHADRLSILMLLGCGKELSVSAIQSETGLTQSMTSQHLAAMRRSGILSGKRDKNKVYYSIANKDILKVISCMKNCPN